MSTSIYMAAISINDNIMIFLAFYNWMSSTGYSIMSSIECRFPSFFIAVIWHNGTYQVLAMTIDKYIAIKWPHKASIYSTPEIARKTSIVTIICIFIYNIPHLFLSKKSGNECLGLSVGGVITKVYSMVSFFIYGVIPFSMLIYMNYIIVQRVRSSRRMFGVNESNENVQISQMRQKTLKNTENQLYHYVALGYHVVYDTDDTKISMICLH